MKRLILVSISLLFLAGCRGGLNIRNEVQEVKVPLLYCPAPPEFLRPVLEINNLTDAELRSDGRVAQAYAASMLQLLGYTKELEESLKFYEDANLAYEELELRLRNAVANPEGEAQ